MRSLTRAALVAIALALTICDRAGAVTITYQADDLLDLALGKDRWRYSYKVSDNFTSFGGFDLLFSPTLYADLQDPQPAVNSDWLVSILAQPDASLPAAGIYAATALVNAPSLADVFTVEFIWLGSGAPGSQPFELFNDVFESFDRGETAPAQNAATPASLPSTLLLLGIGLLGLAMKRRSV